MLNRLVEIMRLHRRRLAVMAAALTTLAAIDTIIRQIEPILALYDVAPYRRQLDGLAKRDRTDIVLLGSSRARYAFDPAVFEAETGLSAFNLAVPNAKTAEWHVLVNNLLARSRPRVVVLGVNASEFRADYVPVDAARNLYTAADCLSAVLCYGPSIELVGAYLDGHLAPAWALLHRRYELKMLLQERAADAVPKYAQLARELRARATRPIPLDGFDHPWADGKQRSSIEDRQARSPALVAAASIPAFDPNAGAFSRFRETLDHLGRTGLRIVVAYIPNSPQTERRWRDVEPLFLARIKNICASREVAFLPFDPADLPRTNADYIEEIHVGWGLARRISRDTARLCRQLLVQEPSVGRSVVTVMQEDHSE